MLLHFVKYHRQQMRAMVLIDPLSRAGFTAKMIWTWRLRAIAYLIIAVLRLGNSLGLRRKHIPLRDLRDTDRHARRLIAEGKQREMVKRYSSLRIDLKYNPTANYLLFTLQTLRPMPKFDSTDIPVLILLSAGSSYNKGNCRHSLIEEIPHATVIEIPCNHWPITEKPEAVLTAIETWLQPMKT